MSNVIEHIQFAVHTMTAAWQEGELACNGQHPPRLWHRHIGYQFFRRSLLSFCVRPVNMAVGKNKGLSKGGKKGSKKKVVDPFSRKDWYDVKAPNMFSTRQVGKTLVNRTQGTKIASEGLKHRVFEVSLADLQNDNDAERSFRKFRLIAEDVQGSHVLCNFHGMDLTTDKLR